MTQSVAPVALESIVSLCKRRGFIFQSSEIYGGLASTWDYGPLGVELKRNVKDAWWRAMVWDRDDMVGLDAAILMHPDVWRASGHVDSFYGPVGGVQGMPPALSSGPDGPSDVRDSRLRQDGI